MSKLSKVLEGLGEDYTLYGEVFKLSPLTGKNLGLFNDNTKEDPEIGFKIVFASLSKCDSELIYDDVLDIPLKDVKNMVDVIMRISGLDDTK